MKLLHVFGSFGRGSHQARLSAIACSSGAGAKHHVISLDGELSAIHDMPANTISEVFLAKRSASGAPDLLGLRLRISAAGADVLCTYGYDALDAASANAAGARLPHIHYEDPDGGKGDPTDLRASHIRMRNVAFTGSIIVSPSLSQARNARRRRRLSATSVRHIPEGIDLRRFAPMHQRAPEGALVTVGYFGALNPANDVAKLVTAFAAMRARVSARLVVYGDGPTRPELQNLSRALGARDRVYFRGATAAPEEAYAEFDIFALCADEESVPKRLAEAMACGLPAAATDFGDVATMVSEKNRGFIAAPDDLEAFVVTLTRLVNDWGLRAEIGAANAIKAKAELGAERMIAAHLALYREVCAARR